MIEFFISIAVFLAAHALPARTALREQAISRIGRRAYVIGYSLLSLVLTVWIFSAYARAPNLELWNSAVWQSWIPVLVMPIALALFSIGAMIANPLSISFRKALVDQAAPALVRLVRHPVLWGFALWAASHIPPNGDLASLILFGGLFVFSYIGMGVFDRRKQRQIGEDQWRRLAKGDEAWQSAGRLNQLGSVFDRIMIIAIVIGLTAYGLLMAGGHLYLFGADPLSGLR